MNATTPNTSRKTRGTNLSLDPELVELAKQYFPQTRYKTLTRFVNSALLREYRRSQVKMRKAGLNVAKVLA